MYVSFEVSVTKPACSYRGSVLTSKTPEQPYCFLIGEMFDGEDREEPEAAIVTDTELEEDSPAVSDDDAG